MKMIPLDDAVAIAEGFYKRGLQEGRAAGSSAGADRCPVCKSLNPHADKPAGDVSADVSDHELDAGRLHLKRHPWWVTGPEGLKVFESLPPDVDLTRFHLFRDPHTGSIMLGYASEAKP